MQAMCGADSHGRGGGGGEEKDLSGWKMRTKAAEEVTGEWRKA